MVTNEAVSKFENSAHLLCLRTQLPVSLRSTRSREAAATPAALARLGLLPSKSLTRLPLFSGSGGRIRGTSRRARLLEHPGLLGVLGKSGHAVKAKDHPHGGRLRRIFTRMA